MTVTAIAAWSAANVAGEAGRELARREYSALPPAMPTRNAVRTAVKA